MNAHDLSLTPPLERMDGAARVGWARQGDATRLAELYQRAPCRVLFPDVDEGDVPVAVLLTTSGGLTGGDRLALHADFEPGVRATVTTQAAEKIYRSRSGDARIDVRVKVEDDAWAEWLMQETILFDRARLSRRSEFDVAATGRLLAVESLVFGRAAMGEDFGRGRVRDAWRVRLGGRLVWMDAFLLEGDVAAERRRPFGLGDAAGCATVLYVGADAADHLGASRAALNETIAQKQVQGGAQGGVTCFDGVLLARLIAPDASILRTSVGCVVASLRAAIAGLPARLPRVWSI